ncbi:unnamed protein product, partial [Prorocentrum cordatum]
MAAAGRPGSSGSLAAIERAARPGTTGSSSSSASAGRAARRPRAPREAACNLREFFLSRRPGGLALEPGPQPGRAPHAATETLKERHRQARQAQLREAWAQREVDERGIQRAEEARMQKERKAESLRRQAAKQAAYDEHCRATFRGRRREPTVCQACSGTGTCPRCHGDQVLSQDFFAPAPKGPPAPCWLEFGRKPQGCEACGGFAPGIDGRHQAGTGRCAHCDGHGKTWPELEAQPHLHKKSSTAAPRAPRTRTRWASCPEPSAPSRSKGAWFPWPASAPAGEGPGGCSAPGPEPGAAASSSSPSPSSSSS